MQRYKTYTVADSQNITTLLGISNLISGGEMEGSGEKYCDHGENEKGRVELYRTCSHMTVSRCRAGGWVKTY